MPNIDLDGYIEHKTGCSIEDIAADSPERFSVIQTEALRDLVVMNRIAGTDYTVLLHRRVLQTPECERLSHEIPFIVLD